MSQHCCDNYWKDKLLAAGGIDLLKDTPVEHLASQPGLQSWLISVDAPVHKQLWHSIVGKSCDILMSNPSTLGRTNSSKTDHIVHECINASRWPCTCEYWHPGWKHGYHKVYLYNVPNGRYLTKASLYKQQWHGLDDILDPLTRCLSSRLNVFQTSLPTYVVGNLYPSQSSYIDEHTDSLTVCRFSGSTVNLQSLSC